MVEDSARRNILHIKKINAFIKTYRNNIWEVIVIVMTTVKPWHSQRKKINNKNVNLFQRFSIEANARCPWICLLNKLRKFSPR